MKKLLFILLFYQVGTVYSNLDNNDTIYLKKVTVKERLSPLKIYSFKVEGIVNTTNLLTSLPFISTKKYGINGVTTVSYNGLPSRFTTTKWEGIELNSVMSGDFNFSLLPLMPESKVVLCNNDEETPFNFNVYMPKTSFLHLSISNANNIKLNLNKPITLKKHKLKFMANYYYNQNRFNVLNEFTSPVSIVTLPANISTGRVFGVKDNISMKKNWDIDFASLYLYDYKHIIPPIFKSNSTEYLTYEIYGFKISSKNYFNNFQNKLSYSFTKNFLHYIDSAKTIYSHNNSLLSNINNLLSIILNNKVKLTLSTNLKSEKAISNNYESTVTRNSFLVLPGMTFTTKNTILKLNAGTFFATNKFFSNYNFRLQQKIKKKFSIALLHNRFIKLPNLNDLYWYPGGTPNLSEEILNSTTLQFKYGSSILLNFINSSVKNEILWLPSLTGSYWEPVNVHLSYRKSVSFTLRHSKIVGKLKLSLLNTSTYTNAKDSSGKFLMFIPSLKNYTQLKFDFNKFSISVDYNYYGKRYITTDNTSMLPAFHLFNGYFSYSFKKIRLVFSIYNITNTNYAFIKSNPMPLRYSQVAVIYLFNNKKK